ncbi:hypothetical protein D3C84_875340 [compost metagenome]
MSRMAVVLFLLLGLGMPGAGYAGELPDPPLGFPRISSGLIGSQCAYVGWVERSDTHADWIDGFRRLNPSYGLSLWERYQSRCGGCSRMGITQTKSPALAGLLQSTAITGRSRNRRVASADAVLRGNCR